MNRSTRLQYAQAVGLLQGTLNALITDAEKRDQGEKQVFLETIQNRVERILENREATSCCDCKEKQDVIDKKNRQLRDQSGLMGELQFQMENLKSHLERSERVKGELLKALKQIHNDTLNNSIISCVAFEAISEAEKGE